MVLRLPRAHASGGPRQGKKPPTRAEPPSRRQAGSSSEPAGGLKEKPNKATAQSVMGDSVAGGNLRGFWNHTRAGRTGITRAMSGNWGASLGCLLPLLSSAKGHPQTGPPGPRMWQVQSDTWTSQWCTFYLTSLLQRAAFLTGLPQLHYHEAEEEPVKRDDTLVAPVRGCSRSA
jgi:hypothetical protein